MVQVLDDVLDNYIQIAKVCASYGVVVHPNTLTIDSEAMRFLRERPASGRIALLRTKIGNDMTELTLEQQVARLAAIEDIKQMKAQYCAYADHGYDPEGMASLFTEDAIWDGGDFGRFEGVDAIEPGFPRWMTNLMTCFADSAIRINAIPSALRANPMSPGG